MPGASHLEEVTRLTIYGLPGGPLRCLSAGWDFSFIIDNEGGVWASGSNILGQLANDSSQARSSFAKILSIPPLQSASVGGWHVLAKDEEGETWVWGCNAGSRLGLDDETHRRVPVHLSVKPIQASAGRFHSLMADSCGLVSFHGDPDFGDGGECPSLFITIPSRMKSARSTKGKNEK